MATGKSIIKNYKKDKDFEIIPRELLQHCDKKAKDENGKQHGDDGLSLQAIGLLVNLQSYPEDWELNKTELYKRYSKNGKTSVMRAWDELVEKKYIIQFHKRVGKQNQYIYYFNLSPFTEEEIKEVESLEALSSKENLRFSKSEAQNQKLKMRSSKPATNIEHIKDNTQEHITDETDGHSGMSGKSDHTDHSFHKNHQSDTEVEFNYYTDELPKQLRIELKKFNIEDIKIIKNIFRRALKYVNDTYDYPPLDIDSVIYEIIKTLNKVQYKRKKAYGEQGTYETIEELKPFLFKSFSNAFLDYLEYNYTSEKPNSTHDEPKNDFSDNTPKSKNKEQREPVYAGDNEELKKMIDEFRRK